jgi:hypothetical protein
MQQNRHLSIGDAGMAELRRQLAYKSQWYGSRLVIADRFYLKLDRTIPTESRIPATGYVRQEKGETCRATPR